MATTQKQRLKASYESKSERFEIRKNDYSRQFCDVYSSRLRILGDLLQQKIHEKWQGKYPIKQMKDLRENDCEVCILVGTCFKQQVLKPSILKEVCDRDNLTIPLRPSNYCDESDKLILEDGVQRIRLSGKIEIPKLVTGVVVAVRGYSECEGKFLVEDWIFYESGPQKPPKLPSEDRFVLLLSGLKVNSSEAGLHRLELLKHWLMGNFPISDVDSAKVVRVVIAGNSLDNDNDRKPQRSTGRWNVEHNKVTKSCLALDSFISDLCRSIPVDLMAGESDLSNLMMPQQKMHPCIFPQSRENSNFACVTNPYDFEIEGVRVLGTSGNNTNDIQKNSDFTSSLECLRAVVTWSHLAPTCPDTVPAYPFHDEDPFVIQEAPHVMFAGNADKFAAETLETRYGSRVSLVTVPEFHNTGSGVLLNLRSLESRVVSFDLPDLEEDS